MNLSEADKQYLRTVHDLCVQGEYRPLIAAQTKLAAIIDRGIAPEIIIEHDPEFERLLMAPETPEEIAARLERKFDKATAKLHGRVRDLEQQVEAAIKVGVTLKAEREALKAEVVAEVLASPPTATKPPEIVRYLKVSVADDGWNWRVSVRQPWSPSGVIVWEVEDPSLHRAFDEVLVRARALGCPKPDVTRVSATVSNRVTVERASLKFGFELVN